MHAKGSETGDGADDPGARPSAGAGGPHVRDATGCAVHSLLVRHVLLIGGPPGSGKTTVATRIARRHGLRWYNAATRTWAHRDRAIREGNAAAVRWEEMTPRERMSLGPEEALELSLHRERGPMVIDDLDALPRSPLVVAEGSIVPVAGVEDPSRAVWLIPTPGFQQAQLEERGAPRGARELYMRLAEAIEREAREHDVPVLPVDGSRGIDETVKAVEARFDAALREGPRAETPAERRALLREANEAGVMQVRSFYARPWAEGDADRVVRTFLCECGDPGCEVSVDVAVGVAASAPVLAAAHG